MEKIKEKLDLIIEAAEDGKGMDIMTIDISENSSIADYFVLVSANSTNQATAIADRIDKSLIDYTEDNFVKEGYKAGRWIVLDYGEIIVHVFHKDEREFYNLEKLLEEVNE